MLRVGSLTKGDWGYCVDGAVDCIRHISFFVCEKFIEFTNGYVVLAQLYQNDMNKISVGMFGSCGCVEEWNGRRV